MDLQNGTPEGHGPVQQVNTILQNLRGEHFRQSRNQQRRPASSSALASHVHNQPTLPFDLIYPSQSPEAHLPSVPGPTPPKSWRSPAKSTPSSILWPVDVADGTDADTPAWRECALSLLFAADGSLSSAPHLERPHAPSQSRSRPIYPHAGPIPPLTLLCLQRVRTACSGADLAEVASYIPVHLRRALMRYTAIHAPLSQIEFEALCQGETHVNTELIVVAPHNALPRDVFRKDTDEEGPSAGKSDDKEPTQWDAVQTEEDSELYSLAILASRLLPATMLTFPPTITHLALIDLYTVVPLQRLPDICPLLVFLDLSYNKWLYVFTPSMGTGPVIAQVKWRRLSRLKILGLRGCRVDRELLLKVNKGRWEDVKIIQ